MPFDRTKIFEQEISTCVATLTTVETSVNFFFEADNL